MTIEHTSRLADRSRTYFTDSNEPQDRFENALAAFRALDGLLCGQMLGGHLDHVSADDFISLLRLVGREFQEVHNAQAEQV